MGENFCIEFNISGIVGSLDETFKVRNVAAALPENERKRESPMDRGKCTKLNV